MKIAIIHDQLREFGGAERVLVMLKRMFPHAPVYTSTYDPNSLGEHKNLIKKWDVRVSWFGKIPLVNKLYSPFRFVTPLIWGSFDLSGYDLVISSTGSWMCKGVKTKKSTIHISYIHHPPRYLYGYETAIEWQKNPLIRIYGTFINHFLRIWDFEVTQNPDFLIANSVETARRIKKFYRRKSTVIYPSVLIPKKIEDRRLKTENYYITVSRLAKAKHIDLLIKTANTYKIQLKIIGIGRDMEFLKSLAGKTVTLLGNVGDHELSTLYKNARAFLFASVDEEFGIAPIEAMGHGLPVIAYASGGLIETVHEEQNGYLFHKQDKESLYEKIAAFERLSEQDLIRMKQNARKEAEKYTEKIFQKKISEFINSKLKS
ncbi:MAG: glycosyltransferase [Patescibacteria group bacterium]